MSILNDRQQCLPEHRPIVQLHEAVARWKQLVNDDQKPLYERWFALMLAEQYEGVIDRRIRETKL